MEYRQPLHTERRSAPTSRLSGISGQSYFGEAIALELRKAHRTLSNSRGSRNLHLQNRLPRLAEDISTRRQKNAVRLKALKCIETALGPIFAYLERRRS